MMDYPYHELKVQFDSKNKNQGKNNESNNDNCSTTIGKYIYFTCTNNKRYLKVSYSGEQTIDKAASAGNEWFAEAKYLRSNQIAISI